MKRSRAALLTCLVFVLALAGQVNATTKLGATKNVAGYQIETINQAANAEGRIAEATQVNMLALAEAKLNCGAARSPANFNQLMAPAQADSTSGGDYDVILPSNLANSLVVTQLHFGKEVAYANYLAAGVRLAIPALHAQWHFGSTTQGAGVAT